MTLSAINASDLILCDVRGRIFHAEVLGREGDGLTVRPLQPNITYRHVTARQVTKHWRLAGRPRPQRAAVEAIAA
jgi:hypothetical protein